MSTPAEMEAVTAILQRSCSPVIVDLGAYCGEDSEWMREACEGRHLLNVMVEPDPRNCEIIRRYRRGKRTILIQGAVADYTGLIDFHFANDQRCDGARSGSGSIKPPSGHVAMFPEIEFPAPRPVMCFALDYLWYSLCEAIDLLWVDIQGAEREMILGGRTALAHTRYLFIEAEQTELYSGQALREELLSLLPTFKVIREFDYNLLLEQR